MAILISSMQSKSHSVILMIICFALLFIRCEKERESNDIVVNINMLDENENTITDKSGVDISLSSGKATFHGITDVQGQYIFKGLPYDIFNVTLKKPEYISYLIQNELSNSKEDSTLIRNFTIIEVPKYQITIDSIISESEFGEILVGYGKFKNTKGLPKIQYRALLYFNNNSGVSNENYLFYHYATILRWKINGDNCVLRITNWVNQYLIPPGYNSLYVRLYPSATYSDWGIIRPEAFGIPSDVYKWVIHK